MGRQRIFVLGIGLGFVLAQTYNTIMAGLLLDSIDPIAASYGSTRSLELIEPESTVTTANKKETFHVLYGMMGTTASLYDAWEVSLKSVLVNAPTDANMQVHVICSQDAHDAVKEKIKGAELEHSRWRNQITITTYNVEAYNQDWREFLRSKMRHDQLYDRISLGGYYRLLAYKILAPLNIGPTLYMDTDVVVLANLNDLIKNVDDTKIFQGSSTSFCSGFTVINMRKFHEFWDKVDKLEQVPVVDQDIMLEVLTQFPDTYGALPLEWDRNLGNGYRRRPHKILNHKEAAGMLHYQGGSGRHDGQNYFTYGFEIFCDRSPVCRDNKEFRQMVARSWGLGDFYTRLTWKWAKYFGKSAIALDQEGFKLQVNTFIANHTVEEITSGDNSSIH